ncbi:hypothetical protein [Methylobacterium sp. CM6247]
MEQKNNSGMTTNILIICIIALFIGSVVVFSRSPDNKFENSDNIEKNKSVPITSKCSGYAEGSDKVLSVNNTYELRSKPDQNAGRILNSKATNILKKDHFHGIDISTTVKELCKTEEWSQVQIVTPDWLSEVVGWAPTKYLGEIKRNSSGQRVFGEKDIIWDTDTNKFKAKIVSKINNLIKENADCGSFNGLVTKSGSKGSPSNPVFFITCERKSEVYNVWFDLK